MPRGSFNYEWICAKSPSSQAIKPDLTGSIYPYLLFRQFQHLSGLEHVALQAVQLHDLRVSTAFAEVRLRDLPERVAVPHGIRPACGFRFRRDRLAGESIVVLLHRRQERVPMRQDVLRALFARIEVLVRVHVRLGIETVLFAQPRHQLGGRILAQFPVADALYGDRVEVAAERRAVLALGGSPGAAVSGVPAALVLTKILPDLRVPDIIMNDHAGHIAVVGRSRVLLRRIRAGRNFNVAGIVARYSARLACAVVQLGAGLHLLPLLDPGRHVLRGE